MSLKTLKSALEEAKNNLVEAGTAKQRAAIDKQLHFVPLNLAVLDTVLGDKLVEGYSVNELREDIIKYIKRNAQTSLLSVNGTLRLLAAPTEELSIKDIQKYTSKGALVYEGRSIKGVLYSNYASTQTNLFKNFLNTELVNKLRTAQASKYKETFDPGHTVFDKDSSLGTAPIAKKVEESVSGIYSRFYEVFDTLNPKQQKLAARIFKNISKADREFDVHSTYSAKVYGTLTKDFKDSLLSVKANIILIQDTLENRGKFSAEERKFLNKVTSILEKELPVVNFSNNLYEEIEERIFNAISGKKSKPTKATKQIDLGTSKTTTKGKAKTSAAPADLKLRNLETRRLIGLPRLLILLNSHIQDVVSANMQDPADFDRGSRKLLTYRTGRFAESVKVERLSASRQGMITAFYSYMKNPYATFTAGGKQQMPRSRDPKALISKSIREIAAKYVAEQLRAVNV